jgi:hypothetical protein
VAQLPDETSDLEIKDLAGEVSGLRPERLLAIIDGIGPRYDGLPAAAERQRELAARRASIVARIADVDARIESPDSVGDDGGQDALRRRRVGLALSLHETQRGLAAAEEQLDGITQSIMDVATLRRAAQRELARQEHARASTLRRRRRSRLYST